MRLLLLAATAAAVCLVAGAGAQSAGSAGLKHPLTQAAVKTYTEDVTNALTKERAAVQKLLANTHESLGEGAYDVTHARQDLYQTKENLADDSFTGASPMADIDSAYRTDGQVEGEWRQQMSGDNFGKPFSPALVKKLVNLLGAAIQHKKHALTLLNALYVTAEPAPPQCNAEKPFQVFAIPAGFSGSYADVYPHGIPKDAKNIKASFVDLATGKAPSPEVFPGQTWTSEVKGFLADGRLDVRVNVTGQGFGKQDANFKNWKVVVTYDCP